MFGYILLFITVAYSYNWLAVSVFCKSLSTDSVFHLTPTL